jgi:Mg2+ and Co2+ transporter CorA
VQESGIEKSGDEVVDESSTDDPVSAPEIRDGSSPESASSDEEILAGVHRLEAELARYHADAERTSKLFNSATRHAELIRERARRDSELALRKVRARVAKLERATSELEQTEDELARVQDELARLRSLTDETRARLSAFLAAGLEALNSEQADDGDDSLLTPGDLQDTLHERLAASQASSTPPPEVDRPQL